MGIPAISTYKYQDLPTLEEEQEFVRRKIEIKANTPEEYEIKVAELAEELGV